MVRRAACAVALVAACGGKGDGGGGGSGGASGSGSGSALAIDAAGPPPADGTTAAIVDGAPSAPGGDLAVKVEWKDTPTVARSSPGRTPCNTPRAASVAPTTMWHIPEAFVFVEGAGVVPKEARVRFADCAFAPRVAVGASLVLESASDRPVAATIAKWGAAADLGKLAAGEARTIQLPIAGHAVAIALEPGGVYRVAAEGAEAEVAWIIAAPAAVTEASGQVQLRAPVGARAVRAFVPARGGQPARVANGTATVVADDLVETTVTLSP